MSKRSSLIVLTLLAGALAGSGIPKAVSQQPAAERTQTLVIGYPNPAITISPSGTRYNGIIYVRVTPVTPALLARSGGKPVGTAELGPSQRDLLQLPLGEYEVQFGMRTGGEMKTFIVRDVILRADRPTSLVVEMNADAKTTIIGGDMTAREMADSIRQLQQEIARLKQK
jgi:hypothetical protein